MIESLKNFIKPLWHIIDPAIYPAALKMQINYAQFKYKRIVKRVKKKERIRVAFLLVNESIWKYEALYFLLKENPRYEPVVFVCPFKTYGPDIQKQEMDITFKNFQERGYEVVKTLQDDGSYLDINKSFSPDIVFFCTPWAHSLKQYHIKNYLNSLTCYVPYGFKSSNLYEFHFNLTTQNLSWKNFYETDVHLVLAKKYSRAKGANVVVSGFPGMDHLLNMNKLNYKGVWKKQPIEKKKIIWAPHHTIPGSKTPLDYSTFLKYSDFMLELARKYQYEVQFAFKPHPNLKGTLYDIWGKYRADNYYESWKQLPNGQLETGSYIELFASSDAMIHDSGSFVIEYLYTQKPVMFLINNEAVKEQFNEIGREALQKLYHGHNGEDIERFIVQTVLNGVDKLREERHKFFNELIQPPHGRTASENIYNYIIESLASDE